MSNDIRAVHYRPIFTVQTSDDDDDDESESEKSDASETHS